MFDVYITNDRIQKEWIYNDNPAVAAYLVNFDAGRTATPESDFLSNLGYDSNDVKELGLQRLKTLGMKYPRLTEYDISREKKYGPQGWIYPIGDDRMIEKIEGYYTACNAPCKYTSKAMSSVLAFASEAHLKPYSYAQVVARGLLKTELATNSGLPYFTKRAKVISENIELAGECRDSGKIFPAVIGARSIKQKQRLIFMAPFEQNLRELSYVYPIMDYLLAHSPGLEGWRGQPYVQKSISDDFFGGQVTLLSTDFTSMDMSMGPAQLATVLQMMEAFFLPEYREDLRRVILQSSSQPVLVGALTEPGEANRSRNKKRYIYLTGTHGLFSGLGFTNLAETLIQLLLDAEFSDHYSVIAAQVNGDDGAKAIDGHKNMDRVASTFALLAGRMGLIANPDKQLVSYDELHYLQRVYSPETEWGGIVHGAYPLMLTLNSAKNPERQAYLTEAQRAVRLIMIFENLADNPYKDVGYSALIAGSPYIQTWLDTGAGAEALARGYEEMVNSDVGSNLSGKVGISGLDVVKTLQNDSSLREISKKEFGW